MIDDDRVFKALADPTRRFLLDLLFARDGRTLTELESDLEMTRFGVMKHLRVLEDAGLVVTRRSGREKLHFLNPVPIRLVHDRWIDKYTERRVSALADLKHELEARHDHDDERRRVTTQVYRVYIKASPEAIWEAITDAGVDRALRLRRRRRVRPAARRRVPRARQRGDARDAASPEVGRRRRGHRGRAAAAGWCRPGGW